MQSGQDVLRCCRRALPVLLLAVAACQTTADGPIDNVWNDARRVRLDDNRRTGAPISSGAVSSNTHEEKTSFFTGTGRFIGDRPSSSPPTTARGDDSVTLNLVNVSVPQAAKTVLSDILAVKYTVDPSIEGKVTIQTPAPVAKSEVADLFQAALRANGAALINAGGTFKIVPGDQAALGAGIRLGGASEGGDRLGSRVQVVQLKYVAAPEIKRILEPISPRGGIVQTDAARNTITLSGNSQDIAGMLDAISIFDVDVMKGMSFALVPVKTSQPDLIAENLRSVFTSDREGPMAGMVRFIPNKQLNAVLVISPQPEYLSRAEAWVRRFDARAEGSEKQFFTYSVQNRRAQELVDVLQSIFATDLGGARGGGSPRNVSPQYREANLQSGGASSTAFQRAGMSSMGARSASASPQSPIGQAAFGLTQSPQQPISPPVIPDVAAAAQPASAGGPVEPRIKIAVDEGKNAILVEATQADYRRVIRVLGNLDVMPNQVLIEATIAEISLNDDLKFGLRWYLQDKNASYTFTDAASGAVTSVFPGFSYALSLANVSMTLNALNEITDVNVISSPSLTVMDNRTAVLQIGDEVPITTQSAVSVIATGAPVVNSIAYKDTGVILAMTPRINSSGRILLDLEQEVSTVVPTTSSGIDSPTIRQRRIRTSVVVNNGEALALGGLIQDSKTLSRTQIPILGDIPLIGNAFKRKNNQIAKTELVIIITPHVMRNISEARRVTDEFRQELAGYRAPRPNRAHMIDQTLRRTLE